MPTSIDSLPDELLCLILVCLPADYLHDIVRLVCRRWYDIIHSHYFINAHLQRSTYCPLYFRNWFSDGRPIWMLTQGGDGLIQMKEFSYICRNKFLGTCNGLVLELLSCTDYKARTLQIVNPATKKAFVLPRFSLFPEYTHHMLITTYYGIAYAAASIKYKVAISYHVIHISSPLEASSGLAILTVGVDNSWRQVPVDKCLSERARAVLASEQPHFTEGFMHYVEQDRWNQEYITGEMVVTLDVETEILTVSELPNSGCPFRTDPYRRKPKFYHSTGRALSLLIARGLSDEDRRFLELWEMNPQTKEWKKLVDDIKLGDPQQQLRLQQLGIPPDVHMTPLGWIKYPEVLVFSVYDQDVYDTSTSRIVISYNLDTHEISSIEPFPEMYYTYAMYKNSLLWLA